MKKPNVKIGSIRLLSALVLLLTGSCMNQLWAVQQPPITQRIETNPSTLVPVNVGAMAEVDMIPKTGPFTDVSVVTTLEFGVNQNYPLIVPATGSYTIDVEVTPYDQSNTMGTVDTITFTVYYDPSYPNPVTDRDVKLVTNAWHLKAKIIKLNGSLSGALPKNMYLDVRLDIDRVFDFSTALSSGPVFSSINLIDIDGISGNDEIEINWTPMPEADEYQLEWTYIDNYDVTISGTLPLNTLSFDFKNNSTRITTTATTYRIANVFDRGWVLFRLRAVGRHNATPNDYLTTVWNNLTPDNGNDASVVSARIQITVSHEPAKNWQSTTTYAEEGKKKDVVSYFSGDLRNRQTITRINTDENVVVGETIYDYQGRPAINVLPSPVNRYTGVVPALHYYESFNVNLAGDPYDRNNFDLDDTLSSPCNDSVQPMDTTNGASRYYSGNSTLIDDHQAYVPDAAKYPFSQVEYTPDNTGRIRRQGGVGKDFQLNSGHETRYLYGQPNQLQLDRLFGSEAGEAAHFKKNVVVDPNGQSSVSYLDMSGHVVATALAGDSPQNLDSLDYDSTAQVLLVDLFNKDANGHSNLNTPNISQNSIDFSTQLTVPYAGWYTFEYDFSIPSFSDTCLADSICFSCIYDLTLHITNECGENLALYDSTNAPIDTMVVGHFQRDSLGNIQFLLDCSDSLYSFTPSYRDTLFLQIGSYTITKTLTVDEDAVAFYVDAFVDSTNNHCIKTLHDFEQEYLSQVDTTACLIDCSDCITNLGDRDEFVANGLGTALEYDVLYENCLKDCKKLLSPCEAAYEMMLVDVSPAGQYGQYMTGSGATDPSGFLLSVLNINNHLPGNMTAVGAVTQNGTWHHPVTTLNGNTYNHYINDDGSIATVNVFFDGINYSPEFTGTTMTDGSGQEYVYVENLLHEADFVSIFRPEWAKGIVYLHPEYCYYEKCREYGVNQGSEVFSSDQYDEWLKTAATFQQAQTGLTGVPNGGKFIGVGGVPFDPSVASTTNLYDPFLDPANSGIFGSASTQFMTKWNQYMPNPSGGWYNMFQAAAATVRCGGLYGILPSATCDDFGQPIVGLTPAQMTELLDKEWNTYKGFYAALKSQVQQNLGDDYALHSCYGLNDCIGNNDHFNPFTSGMINYVSWSSSAYFEERQPCSYYTRSLYADKTTRFPDANAIPGHDMGAPEAGYQYYLQTGQCPKVQALEGILNEFAGNTNLDILTTEALLPYTSYQTFFLVEYNYAPPVAITSNPLSWKASSVTTDNIKVDFIDATSAVKFSIELDKTGLGIPSWDDITLLSNMQPATSGTATAYPHKFSITARVDTLDTCIVLSGSTTYDLDSCTFPEKCDASQFAQDIQTLMSALASTSQLTSTGITLAPTYDLMTSAGIRTKLGVSPTTSLDWKYSSGTQTWSLYPTAGSPPKFEFKIVSWTPGSFSLGSLSSIKSFTNIQSAYQNFFTVEGRDASNNLLVTLKCSAKWTDASSVVSPIEMGECALPVPLACQADPYVITHDLGEILAEALEYHFNGGNIDLMVMSTMSTTVASNIGVDSTSSVYHKDTLGPVYQDSLIFNMGGCDLVLYTNTSNPAVHIEDIIGMSQIVATGPSGFDNYQHNFVALAQFPGVVDSIFGHSDCLPFANCDQCLDSAALSIEFPTNEEGGMSMRSGMFSAGLSDRDLSKITGESTGGILHTGEEPMPMAAFLADTCYGRYQNLMDAYNASVYVSGSGNSLTVLSEDLVNCDCLHAYTEYLDYYLHISNKGFPAPLGIDEFCADTCYAQYEELINEYNFSSYATTVKYTLTPVSEETFNCNCLHSYTDYLDVYITTTNYKLSHPLGISEFCDDTCYNRYELLIEEYNGSYYAHATGTTLTAIVRDAFNCDCLLPYIHYLNVYISTTDTHLSKPMSIDKFCRDSCYANYILLIDQYNDSDYSTGTGNHLIYVKEDAFNCDCLHPYQNYLGYYIASTDLGLPAPLDINAYCKDTCTADYKLLINRYNDSYYATETSFYLDYVDVISCNCLEAYTDYLNNYIAATNTLMTSPLSITVFCNDSCYVAYQNLINQYNQSNYAAETGFYLTCVKEDAFHCDCLGAYTTFLTPYLATTEYFLPNPPNIDTYCGDTCYAVFNQYIELLHTYNNSAYVTSTGYTLPQIYANAIEFTAANLCNCFANYATYLAPYLVSPPNLSLPAPVTIDMFGGCQQVFDTLPHDTCELAYNNYITAVTSYNTWALGHRIPSVSVIYDASYFTEQGFCYCVEGYIAFLQSIQSGDYSNVYASAHSEWFDIAQYCDGRLLPPCTPQLNPFSMCNVKPLPSIPYHNPCVDQLIQNALENAENAYNQYISDITTQIADAYRQHCMGAVENFTMKYTDKEYHYTLYYYDQAGNLIKTIPPAGINLLSFDSDHDGVQSYSDPLEQQIIADRTNNTQTVFTFHHMATTYEYNSLNQLVKQNMPDHDQMNIFETKLSNGLDPTMTVTRIQYIDGSRGFLTGYTGNRGLLYTTNDAGATWQKVNDLVAANLNQVYMVSNTIGYAVGDDGILLQTLNGGSSWDMMKTYLNNINWNLQALYFTTVDKGVLVGEKQYSVLVDNATTTPTITVGTTPFPNSSFTAGGYFKVTSVTYNASSTYYIAGARHKASATAAEIGRVYYSSDGLTWTEYTQFNAPDLNKVNYYSANHLVSGGNAGTFNDIDLSGSIYNDMVSGVTGKVKDVYYLNNLEGVAIIEETPGAAGIYRTSDGGQTWTMMSMPGDNYQRFEVYSSTGTTAKLIAVADNGIVSRLIVTTGTSFGFIPINNTPTNPNLLSSWGDVSGSAVQAFVGGVSAKLYYTGNANASTVVWTSLTPSSVPGTESIKRIAGETFTSGTVNVCVLLTDAGKLYWVKRSGTTFTDGALTVAGASFSDITHQAGFVYAYDNTSKIVYKIALSASGAGSPTAFTNSNSPGTPDVTSITVPASGSNLIAVGKLGATWKGVLNSPSSGQITWTDLTLTQVPLGVTDLKYVSTTSKAYATTVNGNVYVNSGGSSWQQMESGSTAEFNAIALNSAGTSGAIAANNGVAYTFSFSSNVINLTSVNTSTTNNLNDAIITGASAAFVGDNGIELALASYTTNTIATTLVNIGNNKLNSLAARPSASEVIVVGEHANVRKVNGTISIKINQVYTPALNGVHFIDNNEGYVVGKQYTARHTTDGGTTWSVVKETGTWTYTSSTLPELKSVFTNAPGQATIVGTNGRIARAAGNVYTNMISNTSVIVYDVAYSTGLVGYAVGGHTGLNQVRVAYTIDGGITWSSAGAYSSTTGSLRTVHAFSRNNSFLAAGTNDLVIYGNSSVALPAPSSLTSPPTSGITFNDIVCYDDVDFYLVGDNNTVLKSENVTLTGAGDYATGSWNNTLSINDGLLSQNTTNGTFNINAVALTSFTTGSLGGWFSDLPATPTVQTCYERNFTDESGLYSTKFWYDRLGRIVVSQNSRQYNETTKKYSYTKYDALGRIIEAGEKSENTSSNNFAGIFGTMVNNYYNPNTIDDANLETWINDATGSRKQVTHTYYDYEHPAFASVLPGTFVQQNLRKRIATITYEDSLDSDTTRYDHATHYSYDIHGNVNVLLQENQLLATNAPDGINLPGERFKRLDYDYDLISGNVNEVSYQAGQPDQWYHRYEYDADNRILSVQTSTDHVIWDKDAEYLYYAHGALARTELGRDKIQGVDYAYTLQGWIKGVNSNSLATHNDMGKDAVPNSDNRLFAKDVFGYTLNYFDNDYTPIDPSVWTNIGDRFEADKTGSDFLASNDGLFNGNIRSMVTTITDPSTGAALPNGMKYRYDQLNRIIKAQGYNNIDINPSSGNYNKWGSGSTYNNRYHNQFTYDPNGNIKTQTRYDDAGGQIENLTYRYNEQNGYLLQNRLYHVNETIGRNLYADDIDDQINGLGTGDSTFFGNPDSIKIWNNYRYDEEGRLIQDLSEEIAQIKWRVDGKVAEVIRTAGSSRRNLKFTYDAMGTRVGKHVYNSSTGTHEKSTYYVHDAQGNVLAVYEKLIDTTVSDTTHSHRLAERHMYGNSRIGINTAKVEMVGAPPVSAVAFAHELGLKEFELGNHLGNVLTVVLDRKIPVDDGDYDMDNDTINDSDTILGAPDGLVDYYTSQIVSATDYYPFGIGMPHRQFGRAVDTLITQDTITTVQKDTLFYSDCSSTSGWAVYSTASLSVVSGQLNVASSTSGFGWGTANYFSTQAGVTYTVSFYLDMGSCTGSSIRSEIIDNTYSSSTYGSYTTSGHKTYTFTATGSGFGGITFVMNYPGAACDFSVDSVLITYDTTVTSVVNDTIYSRDDYRYGFNKQEKDNEINVSGGSYHAQFWEYDSRLGRRWNLDPVIKEWESPYSCFDNSPIYLEDNNGDDAQSTTSKESHHGGHKLKLIWRIIRIFNPNWWGKEGKERMTNWLVCRTPFKTPYKIDKPPKAYVKVVNKKQVRTHRERLKVKERNGQPSDQVIRTQPGGQINIELFDDYNQTDQLLIEDATGGNGVGTDPNNNNVGNDLFASPVGPDGPNTSPPITNMVVPVVSNQTRVRVLPNVNGSPNTTIYDARITYSWTESRTKHREYLFGFIPLVWRNSKTDWVPDRMGARPWRHVSWK